ncbi:MAG TPA: BlaI/MecI/CopY family transcriptional regulator [Bryobacteraceae bacterium]|jgi:predicted transcriptional regulator
MGRERQDITEAELTLMRVLWRKGRFSTRQIADEIYGGRAGVAQYATVQKQLERLEAKGFVRRDRTLFVHLFTAAIEADELIGRRLREMADKLCEGSLAPVLSHLARTQSLSEVERRALRELIDGGPEPEKGKRKRSRR